MSSVLSPIKLATTALLLLSCWAKDSQPVVNDKKHQLQYDGILTSSGIESFFGIPYAKSTAGQNRFKAPIPISFPKGHVFNATAPGKACPQIDSPLAFIEGETGPISEDCLNLNVVRPAESSGTRHGKLLPVIVWIYGGGLNSGTASLTSTTPDGMIRQSVKNGQPVIYVAMNYRLNIFGFATSHALGKGDSLNNGLKDQRLALEWIQNNIEAFGGDPNRVTLFGQSSGAMSVAMQILAYGGAGPDLFHGAIVQSSSLEPTSESDISFKATASIAAAAGCLKSSDVDNLASGSASQSEDVINCLRSVPMEKLLNRTGNYIAAPANYDTDIFLPRADGNFLPEKATTLVSKGKFKKMPLILGWDENDGTIVPPTTITTTTDTREFVQNFWTGLSSSSVKKLLSLYPSSDYPSIPEANITAEWYRVSEICTDVIFVCPSVLMGHAMAKKYEDDCDPPVYLYANNQTVLDSLFTALGQPGKGVTHGSELAYLTGNLELSNFTQTFEALGIPQYQFNPSLSDYKLAKEYPGSWAGFSWTQAPSEKGKDTLPGWEVAFPEGKGNGDIYVVGGPHAGMSSKSGALRADKIEQRCGFLNSPEIIKQLQF